MANPSPASGTLSQRSILVPTYYTFEIIELAAGLIIKYICFVKDPRIDIEIWSLS